MKKSIVAVGLTAIDLILDLATFPHEDDKSTALQRSMTRGGNASNVLEVIAQFSKEFSSFLITPLPNINECSDAKFVLDSLQQCNIHTDGIVWRNIMRDHAFPTGYVLRNMENNTRTIIGHRKFADLNFYEFQKSLTYLPKIDWLHFDCRNVLETLDMLRLATDIGVSISIDFDRIRANDERLLLNSHPDLAVFSGQWLNEHGFADPYIACDYLIDAGYVPGKQALWVFSQSERGSTCFEFSNNGNCKPNSFVVIPPQNVKVVDTLGAGDTFIAGLIMQISKGFSYKTAVEFATNLAVLKIGRIGFKNLAMDLMPEKRDNP